MNGNEEITQQGAQQTQGAPGMQPPPAVQQYYGQPPYGAAPPPPYYGQPQYGYQAPQPMYIYRETNSAATAGFVLALTGVFVSWIPVLGWIIWILGLILSIVGIGLSGSKGGIGRGLGIAGVVLSFIVLIILIAIIAGFSAVMMH